MDKLIYHFYTHPSIRERIKIIQTFKILTRVSHSRVEQATRTGSRWNSRVPRFPLSRASHAPRIATVMSLRRHNDMTAVYLRYKVAARGEDPTYGFLLQVL